MNNNIIPYPYLSKPQIYSGSFNKFVNNGERPSYVLLTNIATLEGKLVFDSLEVKGTVVVPKKILFAPTRDNRLFFSAQIDLRFGKKTLANIILLEDQAEAQFRSWLAQRDLVIEPFVLPRTYDEIGRGKTCKQ